MQAKKELNIKIGNNIRLIRDLRNYNQCYVAFKMGVGRSTISTWESGMKCLTVEDLNKLAVILNFGTGMNIINFDADKMIEQYLKTK